MPQSQKGEMGTGRIKSLTDCVTSMQTGYNSMYHPPPLQVLISQALLRGLAEVRFVGNLMGLDHCIKNVNVNLCSMITLTINVQTRGHRERESYLKYMHWDSYKSVLTLQ